MWIEFTSDYDWRPPEKPNSHVAYKAGMIVFVRKQCGLDAIAGDFAQASTKKELINGRQFR